MNKLYIVHCEEEIIPPELDGHLKERKVGMSDTTQHYLAHLLSEVQQYEYLPKEERIMLLAYPKASMFLCRFYHYDVSR